LEKLHIPFPPQWGESWDRKGPLLFTLDVNYTNLEETNTTGRGVTVIVDRVMMRCQAAISQHHSGPGFASL